MVSFIKLLAEHNIREGFVEPGTFEGLVRHLPTPLDDVARFGFITGWRKQEALALKWSDVDLDHRRIHLRRERSKNEEPRVIVLTDDLLALMQRRWAARQYRTMTGMALALWGVSPPGAADRGLQRRLDRGMQESEGARIAVP